MLILTNKALASVLAGMQVRHSPISSTEDKTRHAEGKFCVSKQTFLSVKLISIENISQHRRKQLQNDQIQRKKEESWETTDGVGESHTLDGNDASLRFGSIDRLF